MIQAVVFDLDGTLAEYYQWEGPDKIGKPILPMLNRVIKEG
jgi:hydroxymethylpyrimidine pyrophosphatase-like HAD family hydrolase